MMNTLSHTSPLIQAEGIYLHDKQRTLLQDINLSIRPNEIITVIGPNGAGKTSLLNVLLGLRKPTKGKISRAQSLSIGYMPQKLRLNPQLPMTVERFLALVDHSHLSIDNALAKTSISELKKSSMHDLSGGEIQRVLLSRALLRKPQLLVLDEPAQGVDVIGQSQLYQLISHLRDELHCGVLMVSHDLHIVMAATDHVICLNRHICCHGHPDNVSSHPAYLEMFGDLAQGKTAESVEANVAIYTHHHNHHHDVHGCVLEESGCKHDSDTPAITGKHTRD